MEDPDRTSAASRFASNAVILRAMGEQIQSLRFLRTLCLTNRLFYSEFVVFLHRVVDLPIDGDWERLDPENQNLTYTKTLFVESVVLLGNTAPDYNQTIQRLLPRMPRLESFVIVADMWALLPSTVTTLHKSCRRLKQIHYHDGRLEPDSWSEPLHPFGAPEPLGNPDFTVFKNLQCLTLKRLHSDLRRWNRNIVRVLHNSPGLRALELSISDHAIRDCFRNNKADHYENFFDRLCNEYAATGSQPLLLRSLRCGLAIYPMSYDSLTQLTDLGHLEELEIDNHGVWGLRSDEEPIELYPTLDSRSGIVFGAFKPPHCPNLRRFRVSQYMVDVHEFLCAVAEYPSFSRKLAVCINSMPQPNKLNPTLLLMANTEFPGLPIQLRMIGLPTSMYKRRSYAEEEFEALISSNADTLEGLRVEMEQALGAELPDTLLTKMNERYQLGKRNWLDFDRMLGRAPKDIRQMPTCYFRGLDAFESVLNKLPRLKQLAINNTRPIDEHPWSSELVLFAARRLALAAPRLVYISIYEQAWRVHREQSGNVELDELEEPETKCVELLHLTRRLNCLYLEKKSRFHWPYQSFA